MRLQNLGYTGSEDARGADLAREKFELFLRAIDGEGIAESDPQMAPPGKLRIEPHSPTLRDHIWWGAGSRATAEETGRRGLNLMSPTLLTEATGEPFHVLQREQIEAFRTAYRDAGHRGSPRVSVSRSVFPIMNEQDEMFFGLPSRENSDQIGIIDGMRSTFGKTYAAAPDVLIDQLKADEAVMEADTLMLTIPNQLGVAYCVHSEQIGWRSRTGREVRGGCASGVEDGLSAPAGA